MCGCAGADGGFRERSMPLWTDARLALRPENLPTEGSRTCRGADYRGHHSAGSQRRQGSTALGLIWQDQSLMAIHHFAMAADDWRRQLRHVAPEALGGDSAPATRARLQLAI